MLLDPWDPAWREVVQSLEGGGSALQGAELSLTSCFITEEFYSRETELHKRRLISERDFNFSVFQLLPVWF